MTTGFRHEASFSFHGMRMDRQQMIAAIQAAMPTLSQAWCEALNEDALAELVNSLPTETPPDAEPPLDPSTLGRDELVAALVDAGADEADLEPLTDEELRDSLAEKTAATGAMNAADRKDPAQVAAFAERTLARVAKLGRSLEAREKWLAARARADKARDAERFCDRMVKEGRLLRSQVAVMALPSLVNLDDTRAIHHFSDGGRTETLTAYELKKRELARMPVVMCFGEKLSETAGVGPEKAREIAVEKARRHAGTVSEQAWKQTSFRTREGFVQKFSETFARSPDAALNMLPENLRG